MLHFCKHTEVREICGTGLRLLPTQGRAWWEPLPILQHCVRMQWPRHTEHLEWLSELQACFEIPTCADLHQVTARSATPSRQALCSLLLPRDLPSLSREGQSGIAQSEFQSLGDQSSLQIVSALIESVVFWDFFLFVRMCKLVINCFLTLETGSHCVDLTGLGLSM